MQTSGYGGGSADIQRQLRLQQQQAVGQATAATNGGADFATFAAALQSQQAGTSGQAASAGSGSGGLTQANLTTLLNQQGDSHGAAHHRHHGHRTGTPDQASGGAAALQTLIGNAR